MTTAYEQVMASLDERVKALEASEQQQNALEEAVHQQRMARLDAALRRIEQLEREVAVLKGPRVYRVGAQPERARIAEFYLTRGAQPERARIAEFYLTRDQVNHAQQLVPAEGLTQGPLPCGCRGPYCGGHQFQGANPNYAGARDANGSPLPDEGT